MKKMRSRRTAIEGLEFEFKKYFLTSDILNNHVTFTNSRLDCCQKFCFLEKLDEKAMSKKSKCNFFGSLTAAAAAASVFWTQFSGPASTLNPLDGAFSYVNGTFHRAITKPFILTITGALYSDSQHLTEPVSQHSAVSTLSLLAEIWNILSTELFYTEKWSLGTHKC